MIPDMKPMLAHSAKEPFDDKAWVYEIKWDGVRTLLRWDMQELTALSRLGNNQLTSFPELSDLRDHIGTDGDFVLDGELISLGSDGKPSFRSVQQRLGVLKPTPELMDKYPIQVMIFDVLWHDGKSTCALPQTDRRMLLEKMIPQDSKSIITLGLQVVENGKRLFETVSEAGLEGVMAKRANGIYSPGKRSRDWLKVKTNRRQEVYIVGYTSGTGTRDSRFGALLVARKEKKDLVYAGRVGTGFTEIMIDDIFKQLKKIETKTAPISTTGITRKDITWVKPDLKCEVEYLQTTKDGKMRFPSFKGLQ